MTKRRTRAPILDPQWEWHSSASHDAGSDAFRARQRERVARMQAKPAPANVAPIAKQRKEAA